MSLKDKAEQKIKEKGETMGKKFFILLAAAVILAMAACQGSIQTDAPLSTVTDTPKAANTPEPTPTDTPTPEPTPTDMPTPEPTPTNTPTPISVPEDTPPPEPTEESDVTPTMQPSEEVDITEEIELTPTDKPTEKPEPTEEPKATPTEKPENTPTPKPTEKPKATPTPKPTEKPKPTEAPKQSRKVSVNATVKENEEYTNCVVEIEWDRLYELCKEDTRAEYTKEDVDASIEFWNTVELGDYCTRIVGVKDKSIEHLVIPEKIIRLLIDNDLGYSRIFTESIGTIGKEAFKDCVNLKSVTFDKNEGRITIEDYAFSGCTGLETFKVYDILEVGEGAFYGCSSLKNIELVYESASIERINKRSFYGCSSLISVKRRGDIPDEAFSGCSSLQTLEGWSGCYKFGEAAFKGCKNLKLPANAFKFVTNVGDEAFYGCESIDTVVFVTDSSMPNSLVYIGDRAFYGCTGLTTLELPYMVRSIGERAFYGCTGLEGELLIGQTVLYIGEYAFAGCSNLTSVQLPMNTGPENIEYIFTEVNDGLFENCTSLTEVQVPYNVLKIAENSFNGCENLKEITVSGMDRRYRAEEGQGGWKEYDFVVDPYYVDNWATSHGYEVKTRYSASGSSKGIRSSGSKGIR